jgi:hypothetical protein
MKRLTCLSVALVAAALEATAMSPCIAQSSSSDCASYQYPEDSVIRDIEDNCAAMPWMIGCSVWQACDSGKIKKTSPYCAPFSILASSCVDDGMENMSGCLAYVKLCKPDSKVRQCAEHPPIPLVVHTAKSQVRPRKDERCLLTIAVHAPTRRILGEAKDSSIESKSDLWKLPYPHFEHIQSA